MSQEQVFWTLCPKCGAISTNKDECMSCGAPYDATIVQFGGKE